MSICAKTTNLLLFFRCKIQQQLLNLLRISFDFFLFFHILMNLPGSCLTSFIPEKVAYVWISICTYFFLYVRTRWRWSFYDWGCKKKIFLLLLSIIFGFDYLRYKFHAKEGKRNELFATHPSLDCKISHFFSHRVLCNFSSLLSHLPLLYLFLAINNFFFAKNKFFLLKMEFVKNYQKKILMRLLPKKCAVIKYPRCKLKKLIKNYDTTLLNLQHENWTHLKLEIMQSRKFFNHSVLKTWFLVTNLSIFNQFLGLKIKSAAKMFLS